MIGYNVAANLQVISTLRSVLNTSRNEAFARRCLVKELLFPSRAELADCSIARKQVREDMEVFWRLGLYPVILVVCWFFASINRIRPPLPPAPGPACALLPPWPCWYHGAAQIEAAGGGVWGGHDRGWWYHGHVGSGRSVGRWQDDQCCRVSSRCSLRRHDASEPTLTRAPECFFLRAQESKTSSPLAILSSSSISSNGSSLTAKVRYPTLNTVANKSALPPYLALLRLCQVAGRDSEALWPTGYCQWIA